MTRLSDDDLDRIEAHDGVFASEYVRALVAEVRALREEAVQLRRGWRVEGDSARTHIDRLTSERDAAHDAIRQHRDAMGLDIDPDALNEHDVTLWSHLPEHQGDTDA